MFQEEFATKFGRPKRSNPNFYNSGRDCHRQLKSRSGQFRWFPDRQISLV